MCFVCLSTLQCISIDTLVFAASVYICIQYKRVTHCENVSLGRTSTKKKKKRKRYGDSPVLLTQKHSTLCDRLFVLKVKWNNAIHYKRIACLNFSNDGGYIKGTQLSRLHKFQWMKNARNKYGGRYRHNTLRWMADTNNRQNGSWSRQHVSTNGQARNGGEMREKK